MQTHPTEIFTDILSPAGKTFGLN